MLEKNGKAYDLYELLNGQVKPSALVDLICSNKFVPFKGKIEPKADVHFNITDAKGGIMMYSKIANSDNYTLSINKNRPNDTSFH